MMIDGVVDDQTVCAYALSGAPTPQQAREGWILPPTGARNFPIQPQNHADNAAFEWFIERHSTAQSGYVRFILQHPEGEGMCESGCFQSFLQLRSFFQGRVNVEVIVLPAPQPQPQPQQPGAQ